MSDQGDRNNSTSSTPEPASEAPLPSLRETIEAAYDAPESPEAGQADRARDSLGRFAAKDGNETKGEAEPQKAPSPAPIQEAQPQTPEPAPAGSSTQVPEHWSADLKAAFTKWAPDVQGEFLNRHREMEADYTRKSQAMSGAVNFTQALTPVFTDPVISGSLKQSGVTAAEAIQEWAGFHKRAMDQDPRERINLLVDLSQRLGFDPARLFVTAASPPAPPISEKDLADPAIRYFADHLGRTTNDLQALRAELQTMRQAEVEQRNQETLQATRWGIDTFADEKDSSGRPLRPHFDAVLPDIIELFKANPERDLNEAYEKAVWANPQVRQQLLQAERFQLSNQNTIDKAKAAARSNTRGITSPVAKPSAKVGNGSLRDLLEKTADEVGF